MSGVPDGAPDAVLDGVPDAGLATALEAFAALPVVLVALDLDGTLAPIVDDPAAARVLPRTAVALSRLAAFPRTHLALVSGRAMDSLRAAARPPEGAVLVASHGAEVEGVDTELDDAARAALAAATADVEAVVAAHPGTAVERKPAGVVLHTRQAAPDVAEQAGRAVLEGAATRDGVHALTGKSVVELSVIATSKGEAVAALRERLGVDAVLFAGDDVTDESVLGALGAGGDVGVKVGEGPSAAAHRVEGPQAVGELLTVLAELRSTAVEGPDARR